MTFLSPRDAHYLEHLERHRRFVLEEALKLHIKERGLTHDLSKFSAEEFDAYAEYFYGGHPRDAIPEDVQAAFDVAWLLHQKRNDHHWQYWILREDDGATKALAIPKPALHEMLADWRGAGKAILGDKADTPAWYARHRDIIIMHDTSRQWLEYLLAYQPPA